MISVFGTQIKPTLFPDGTSQVWKITEDFLKRRHAVIKWEFNNEGEFLHLAQLQDLLSNAGVTTSLELPYLPYGRQDKQVLNDQTFALRTFARLLNSLNFTYVEITDPHSNVAMELINNSRSLYPVGIFYKVHDKLGNPLVCYPDKGATNKYNSIIGLPFISADKKRNQQTGEIEGLEIIGNCKDKSILICDDICDYGNTFIKTASKLLEGGAKEVNLYVSHGLFSGGLKPILDSGIKRVFTKEGEAFDRIGSVVWEPYND